MVLEIRSETSFSASLISISVKTHTSIPVPRVLSWNAEAQNGVGTEYMILEAIPGIPLKDVWNKMTASQHIGCIRSISLLCRQICKLEFPAYGSLYLKANAPAMAVDLDGTFCVGPLCSPQQWDCSIENSTGTSAKPGHRGPCMVHLLCAPSITER